VSQTQARFSRPVFLRDLESTAIALGAPYSIPVTNRVIDTYAASFREGAVLWRATSRPGDSINYRFYERRPTDTIGKAIRAGLLDENSRMAGLARRWSARYPEATELCDFDSERGLSKTWIYLGAERPFADILRVADTPEPVRRTGRRLGRLGLQSVRHVAVNYFDNTLNWYFPVAGPLDQLRCSQLVALANGDPPSRSVFGDMSRFVPSDRFTFSVTLTEHGEVQRVAFYALKLPSGQWPAISGRLMKFFGTAPSRDSEEMNALAWSFGRGGDNYMKAERSYSGRLVELMKQWNSPMTATTGELVGTEKR
jgi:4-hydroxyphenylpyruvate 3-dimethylallyltransferase